MFAEQIEQTMELEAIQAFLPILNQTIMTIMQRNLIHILFPFSKILSLFEDLDHQLLEAMNSLSFLELENHYPLKFRAPWERKKEHHSNNLPVLENTVIRHDFNEVVVEIKEYLAAQHKGLVDKLFTRLGQTETLNRNAVIEKQRPWEAQGAFHLIRWP